MQPHPKAHSLEAEPGVGGIPHWVPQLDASVHSYHSHRGAGKGEGVALQGNATEGPDGKGNSPGEEEHTKVHSRGLHILARGELSFHLPMTAAGMEI